MAGNYKSVRNPSDSITQICKRHYYILTNVKTGKIIVTRIVAGMHHMAYIQQYYSTNSA